MPDNVYSGAEIVGRTAEVQERIQGETAIGKTWGGIIDSVRISIKRWLGICTQPSRNMSPLGALNSVKNFVFNSKIGAMVLRPGHSSYATTITDVSGSTLATLSNFFPLSTESPSATVIDLLCGIDGSANKFIFQKPFWHGSSTATDSYLKWGETLSAVTIASTATASVTFAGGSATNNYYKNWMVRNSTIGNSLYVSASSYSGGSTTLTVIGNVPSNWVATNALVLYRHFHDNYSFAPTYSVVAGRPPVGLQQGNGLLFSGGMGSTVGLKPIWSGYLNKTFFDGAINKTGGIAFNETYVSEAEIKNTNGITLQGSVASTSWAAETSGTTQYLYDIFFLDANNGWAVGNNKILNTSDGGATWNNIAEPVAATWYGVFFVSSTTGWIVGTGGKIYKTTDTGANWTSQTSGLSGDLKRVFFTDANTGWAVGANGTGGSITYTSNGGTAWTAQTLPTSTDLYDVHFISSTVGWCCGGAGTGGSAGHIYKTTNAGTTWTEIYTTAQYLYGIRFADATHGWSVGTNGTIVYTSNGGTDWAAQISGTAGSLQDIEVRDVNTAFIVGETGTILSTTNTGTNWTALTSGTANWLYGCSFISSSVGWACGQNGTILKASGASSEALTVGRWFYCLSPETDDGLRGNPTTPAYVDIEAGQCISFTLNVDFAQLNKRLRYLNLFIGIAPNSTDTTINWANIFYFTQIDLLADDMTWTETSTTTPGYYTFIDVFDGADWNDKSQESLDQHLGHEDCTSTTASFSEGLFLNNRLFIGKYYDYVDALEYLDQIRYSDFAGNGKAQLNVLCNLDDSTQSTIEQGDPTSVQALRKWQDKLFILKDRSCYFIPITENPENWELITISGNIGCTVPATAVETPFGIMWCQNGEDVYLWNGGFPELATKNWKTDFRALTPVKGWYDNNLKTYNFYTASGIWYSMFFECPVPNGFTWGGNFFGQDGVAHTYAFIDVSQRAGTIYEIIYNANAATYKIIKVDYTATNDDTLLGITPYFKTEQFVVDEKDLSRILKWYLTLTPTGGSGTLDCKLFIGSNTQTYLNIGKTLSLHSRGVLFTNCTGRTIQFEFNTNATRTIFTALNIYELQYDYEQIPFTGDNTITG